MNLDKSKQMMQAKWMLPTIWFVFGLGLLIMYWGLPAWMHDRGTLQQDYEEVFATPFKDVQVSE